MKQTDNNNNNNKGSSLPAISLEVHDGKVFATSLQVAEMFGKEHYIVMRDIQQLAIPDDYREYNFVLYKYSRHLGNNVYRDYPMYLLTRQGCLLLIMGYNTRRAMEIKIAYMQAFDEMEKRLAEAAAQPRPQLPDFTSPVAAARAWIAEYEAREKAEKELAAALPKAQVYDDVVAPRKLSLNSFCRRLRGVNLNQVKQCLCNEGVLYRQGNVCRPYAAYRDTCFEERFNTERGWLTLIVLPKGQQLLVEMYEAGKLILKNGFALPDRAGTGQARGEKCHGRYSNSQNTLPLL